MYEVRKHRTASRLIMALLSVALVFTMMPLSMGAAFAADAADYQPALTITGVDGKQTAYQTREDVIAAFGTIDDDSFGVSLKGCPIKRILKDLDENAIVNVQTQDDYDVSKLNANGKTVKYLKDNKFLLAYQEGDTMYDPTSDEVNSKGKKLYGGYFILYGKNEKGEVVKDKWVNRIAITAGSGEGDDPQPAAPVLTITGDGLASELVYEDIKTLKNDEQIKPLIKENVVFHTKNSAGTEEDFTVTGVTIEDLIKLAGLKEGMELDTVTAAPVGENFSKTYTADQILKKDLKGNKAMFIWNENGEKVQKTAIGQFTAEDTNRSLWVRGDALTLTVTAKAVEPTPAPVVKAPGKVKIKAIKAGKKKATITWGKVKGAKGYVIYRSTKKNKGFKKVKTIKSGKTVKFVNKKLKKGKTYYYKMRAYKVKPNGKKIYGKWSNVKKVKIRK